MTDSPLKPDCQPDRQQLRQQIRQQRRNLSLAVQQQHSQALCRQLIKHPAYRHAHHVAAYLASDGEIDPLPLLEHAWLMKKTVYLPVLSPLHDRLVFAPYAPDSRLRLNRFNIPEPACPPSRWKTARQLDLILLPLVAFDAQGNRLGMGGGFYDRSLAYLRQRRYWHKPVLLGLAHECQKVEKLAMQPWDIPLNGVVTEAGVYPQMNANERK